MKLSLRAITAIFLSVIILSAAILTSCAASGDTGTSSAATSAAEEQLEEQTEDITTEPPYIYPNEDFNGEEFVIMNIEPVWNFYTYLDFENMTGDALDDSIYSRNRFIEDKFNIKFTVVLDTIDTMAATIKATVLAGDDTYDVTYCRGDQIGPLVTERYFYNLFDLPELNLEKEWWDQTAVKAGIIGDNDALYFAASDLTLMGFYGTWCVFFNERMCENLGLDKPYQLVRDGKWTIDRMIEYSKAGTSLNGDEGWGWNPDGSSVYGMTSYSSGVAAWLSGTGERYIKQDADGNPYFALNNERFYKVAEKIASLTSVEGSYLEANEDTQNNFHYEAIFKAGRAFFATAEIKASGRFRDMEDTFGMLPTPKLDETQENYINQMFTPALLACIPVTQQDTHFAATILDASSYQSYADVMPVFYDVTVSQKGLRNSDSIEMLNIIRDTRYFDIGVAYGWTTALHDSIRVDLAAGKSDLASSIQSKEESITANIEKTMEIINAG